MYISDMCNYYVSLLSSVKSHNKNEIASGTEKIFIEIKMEPMFIQTTFLSFETQNVDTSSTFYGRSTTEA